MWHTIQLNKVSRMCVCVCVRVCICANICVCKREREREREDGVMPVCFYVFVCLFEEFRIVFVYICINMRGKEGVCLCIKEKR